jgi:hypothetical protein
MTDPYQTYASGAGYQQRFQELQSKARQSRARAAESSSFDYSMDFDTWFGTKWETRDRETKDFWENALKDGQGYYKFGLQSQVPGFDTPFLRDLDDAIDLTSITMASKRIEAGTASREDWQKVFDYAEWTERPTSWRGVAGGVVSELPAYVFEGIAILGTGGPASPAAATKAGLKGAIHAGRLGLKTFVSKAVNGLVKQTVRASTKTGLSKALTYGGNAVARTGRLGSFAVKGATLTAKAAPGALKYAGTMALGREAVGAAALTPVSFLSQDVRDATAEGAYFGASRVGRVVSSMLLDAAFDMDLDGNGAMQITYDEDVDWTQFLPRALFQTLVEDISEGSGLAVREAAAGLNIALRTSFLMRAAEKLGGKGRGARKLLQTLDKAGLGGTLEELGEEQLGNFLTGAGALVTGSEALEEDFKAYYDPTNLVGMATGILIGGGGMRVGAAVGSRAVEGFKGETASRPFADAYAAAKAALNRGDMREAAAVIRDALKDADVTQPPQNEPSDNGLMWALGPNADRALKNGAREQAVRTVAELEGFDYDNASQSQQLDWEANHADAIENAAEIERERLLRLDDAGQQEALDDYVGRGLVQQPSPDVAQPRQDRPRRPQEEQQTAPRYNDAASVEAVDEGPDALDLPLYDLDPEASRTLETAQVGQGEATPSLVEQELTEDAWSETSREYGAADRMRQADEVLRRATNNPDATVVGAEELDADQQLLANLAYRANKTVHFVRGLGAPAVTDKRTGEILIDVDLAAEEQVIMAEDGKVTTRKITGVEAVESNLLHEGGHRVLDTDPDVRRLQVPQLIAVFNEFMPGAHEANTAAYLRRWLASGRAREDLSDEMLAEEGAAATFGSLFQYLGAMARTNNVRIFEKMLSTEDNRSFLRKVGDALQNAASLLPGISGPKLQSVETIRSLIRNSENLSDADIGAQAGIAQALMEAFMGAGMDVDAAEGALIGWREQRERRREQGRQRTRVRQLERELAAAEGEERAAEAAFQAEMRGAYDAEGERIDAEMAADREKQAAADARTQAQLERLESELAQRKAKRDEAAAQPAEPAKPRSERAAARSAKKAATKKKAAKKPAAKKKAASRKPTASALDEREKEDKKRRNKATNAKARAQQEIERLEAKDKLSPKQKTELSKRKREVLAADAVLATLDQRDAERAEGRSQPAGSELAADAKKELRGRKLKLTARRKKLRAKEGRTDKDRAELAKINEELKSINQQLSQSAEGREVDPVEKEAAKPKRSPELQKVEEQLKEIGKVLTRKRGERKRQRARQQEKRTERRGRALVQLSQEIQELKAQQEELRSQRRGLVQQARDAAEAKPRKQRRQRKQKPVLVEEEVEVEEEAEPEAEAAEPAAAEAAYVPDGDLTRESLDGMAWKEVQQLAKDQGLSTGVGQTREALTDQLLGEAEPVMRGAKAGKLGKKASKKKAARKKAAAKPAATRKKKVRKQVRREEVAEEADEGRELAQPAERTPQYKLDRAAKRAAKNVSPEDVEAAAEIIRYWQSGKTWSELTPEEQERLDALLPTPKGKKALTAEQKLKGIGTDAALNEIQWALVSDVLRDRGYDPDAVLKNQYGKGKAKIRGKYPSKAAILDPETHVDLWEEASAEKQAKAVETDEKREKRQKENKARLEAAERKRQERRETRGPTAAEVVADREAGRHAEQNPAEVGRDVLVPETVAQYQWWQDAPAWIRPALARALSTRVEDVPGRKVSSGRPKRKARMHEMLWEDMTEADSGAIESIILDAVAHRSQTRGMDEADWYWADPMTWWIERHEPEMEQKAVDDTLLFNLRPDAFDDFEPISEEYVNDIVKSAIDFGGPVGKLYSDIRQANADWQTAIDLLKNKEEKHQWGDRNEYLQDALEALGHLEAERVFDDSVSDFQTFLALELENRFGEDSDEWPQAVRDAVSLDTSDVMEMGIGPTSGANFDALMAWDENIARDIYINILEGTKPLHEAAQQLFFGQQDIAQFMQEEVRDVLTQAGLLTAEDLQAERVGNPLNFTFLEFQFKAQLERALESVRTLTEDVVDQTLNSMAVTRAKGLNPGVYSQANAEIIQDAAYHTLDQARHITRKAARRIYARMALETFQRLTPGVKLSAAERTSLTSLFTEFKNGLNRSPIRGTASKGEIDPEMQELEMSFQLDALRNDPNVLRNPNTNEPMLLWHGTLDNRSMLAGGLFTKGRGFGVATPLDAGWASEMFVQSALDGQRKYPRGTARKRDVPEFVQGTSLGAYYVRSNATFNPWRHEDRGRVVRYLPHNRMEDEGIKDPTVRVDAYMELLSYYLPNYRDFVAHKRLDTGLRDLLLDVELERRQLTAFESKILESVQTMFDTMLVMSRDPFSLQEAATIVRATREAGGEIPNRPSVSSLESLLHPEWAPAWEAIELGIRQDVTQSMLTDLTVSPNEQDGLILSPDIPGRDATEAERFMDLRQRGINFASQFNNIAAMTQEWFVETLRNAGFDAAYASSLVGQPNRDSMAPWLPDMDPLADLDAGFLEMANQGEDFGSNPLLTRPGRNLPHVIVFNPQQMVSATVPSAREQDLFFNISNLDAPNGQGVGMSYTHSVNDPTGGIESRIRAIYNTPDGAETFDASIRRDGNNTRYMRAVVPPYLVEAEESLIDNLMFHAGHHAAAYIELEDDALAESLADALGTEAEATELGHYTVRMTAAGARQQGQHFGAARMVRDAQEAITGIRLFEDDDLMFNMDQEVDEPSMIEPGADSLLTAERYQAMLDKLNSEVETSTEWLEKRFMLLEKELMDLAPNKISMAKHVRRWTSAGHLLIDLENTARIKGSTIEQLIDEGRNKAKAQGNPWNEAKEAMIKDVLDMPAEIESIVTRVATMNRVLGQRAQRFGLISDYYDFYSARIWMGDDVSLQDRNIIDLTQGIASPTRAGATFRTGVGARGKRRTYDSILDGWADGKELAAMNMLAISQRVHSDVLNSISNIQFRNVMTSAGFMGKLKDGRAPQGAVELRTNSPGLRGYWVVEALADDLSALTTRMDWQSTAFKKAYRKAYRLNNAGKASVLFTSLFHNFAFWRSFYFSRPGHFSSTTKMVTEAPMLLGGSLLNVIPGADQLLGRDAGMRLAMRSPEVRSGVEAILGESPIYARLVANGMTMPFSMRYGDEQSIDSAQRRTLIEKAVTLFGPLYGRERAERMAQSMQDYRTRTSQFLFANVGAPLKAQAAILEYKHEMAQLKRDIMKGRVEEGQITEDDIARKVAAKMNDDFGGLNYRRGENILGGVRRAENQNLMRLGLLASDWTESNLNTVLKMFSLTQKMYGTRADTDEEKQKQLDRIERRMYRNLAINAAFRSQILTAAFNALMAGLDDDEDFFSRYEQAWRDGNFNWAKVNISPVANMVDEFFGNEAHHPDSRIYFSLIGHFLDPYKWAYDIFLNDDMWGPLKAKGSPIVRALTALGTGTDWKGQSYTPVWNAPGKPSLMEGHLKQWEWNSGQTVYRMPAAMIDQFIGNLPIIGQTGVRVFNGEESAFDFMADGVGLHTTRTYPGSGRQREVAPFFEYMMQ